MSQFTTLIRCHFMMPLLTIFQDQRLLSFYVIKVLKTWPYTPEGIKNLNINYAYAR